MPLYRSVHLCEVCRPEIGKRNKIIQTITCIERYQQLQCYKGKKSNVAISLKGLRSREQFYCRISGYQGFIQRGGGAPWISPPPPPPRQNLEIRSQGSDYSKLFWGGMPPDPPKKVCFMSLSLFQKSSPPPQQKILYETLFMYPFP